MKKFKIITNTEFTINNFSKIIIISEDLIKHLNLENNDHRKFYAKFLATNNPLTVWIDDPKDLEILSNYFTVPITIDLINNTIYETNYS